MEGMTSARAAAAKNGRNAECWIRKSISRIWGRNKMENNLKVVIENKKGTYKSFEIEGDPVWKDYPLAGVTYPVDYGYIERYKSEDGQKLDIFVGSGNLHGYIKVWRYDVPIETKVLTNITKEEFEEVIKAFSPVIKEKLLFEKENDFKEFLKRYAGN